MLPFEMFRELVKKNSSKMLMIVLDGVGGVQMGPSRATALQRAVKPNLDMMASESSLGLLTPIATGITPGSGPSHLSLFGYNPLEHQIGRGVLEALGVDLKMTSNDLAARANFCTLDRKGEVVDRRAGRIPTEKNADLCKFISEEISTIEDVEVVVQSGKEHRFVVLFRGEGLEDGINDTDPQITGVAPLKAVPQTKGAEKSARIINEFVKRATKAIEGREPANGMLLRGIAKHPNIEPMSSRYGISTAAVAVYPMYRGLARLVGMDILDTGPEIADQVNVLEDMWKEYDFFFFHVKKTDSYGEDGNQDAKVKVIEEFDALLPRIINLQPDVMVVTCDHSTPAAFAAHSWHPCPAMLWSPGRVILDRAVRYDEVECTMGALGQLHSTEMMPLMMACAMRLQKFGA